VDDRTSLAPGSSLPGGLSPAGTPGSRAWLIVAAALFALALHPLLSAVVAAGRYLLPHDLAADYLVGALWATLLGATILVWPVPQRDRWILLAAWAARAFVLFGFMLYYEWNYPTLDAYGYYAASLAPAFDWSTVGFGHGTENLNAFAWLHARVVPGSYHAMKATCALAGLAATTLFYRAAVVALGRERPWLLAVLLFTPSLLFWSSILGKDPLILLGVGLYAYGAVCWQRRGSPLYLLHVLAGLAIAAGIRLWFAPILLAPLFVLTLIGLRSALQRIVFATVGAVLLWFAVELFRQQFALATIRELLSVTNQWSQGWAYGGSAQTLATQFTGIGSMIRFLPIGIFAALFRPLPGEVMNLFGLLAGAENLVLVGLAGTALLRTRLRDLRDPLVPWALVWILTWSALYGFISYQNLGTAARFKLQIFPVLLLLSLHLVRRRSGPPARGGVPA
jgi:hypothetical protein